MEWVLLFPLSRCHLRMAPTIRIHLIRRTDPSSVCLWSWHPGSSRRHAHPMPHESESEGSRCHLESFEGDLQTTRDPSLSIFSIVPIPRSCLAHRIHPRTDSFMGPCLLATPWTGPRLSPSDCGGQSESIGPSSMAFGPPWSLLPRQDDGILR